MLMMKAHLFKSCSNFQSRFAASEIKSTNHSHIPTSSHPQIFKFPHYRINKLSHFIMSKCPIFKFSNYLIYSTDPTVCPDSTFHSIPTNKNSFGQFATVITKNKPCEVQNSKSDQITYFYNHRPKPFNWFLPTLEAVGIKCKSGH